MEALWQLLYSHISHYPGMELQDALKLLYQNELGGAHLLEDEAAFRRQLQAEMQTPGLFTATPSQPEAVGANLCRVFLSDLEEGPGVETLARLCVLAAQKHSGSKAALREKALALRGWIQQGHTPWEVQPALEEMDAWLAAGCPQPRHSGRFAALYQPHYRLLDIASALYLPVFAQIDAALGRRSHVLAGIDGMSGAGKSALAGLIATVYGCGVVHADDFFLQPWQRTPQRLVQPGGNIDYERLAPVAASAADDRPFDYAAYDCQRQEMGEVRRIPAGALTVLEGAYTLHPKVGAACDVRVFLSVEAACQQRRITARNGPQQARRFMQEWIPMEHRYFAEFAIREGCDVRLDTTRIG